MKPTPTLSLFFLLIFLILSCHHNRLKTNEKELVKEILTQEKTKKEAEKIAIENGTAEIRSKPTGSFRKKEIRSVDKLHPPVKIDILDTLNNIRKLKLSDVASSIRYVKLQTPPDTTLLFDNFFYRDELMSTIRSDGDQIIFQGLFGLTRFNMQGEYQETIWENKSGIKFYDKSVMFGGNDFFGILPSIPVSISNGNLYYFFYDGPKENCQVMKYKTGMNTNLSVKSQTEMPGQGTILGDTLLNTHKFSLESFNYISGLGPGIWAGINQKWNSGRSGSLLVTYNDKGDTLCKFTDSDRFVNYSFGQGRNAVELKNYYYSGLLTIKQEYNDTVFRLIPPERLLPVYILDFGKYKFSFMEGFNPNFDLSDKFMINSLQETNEYLFIRYTQNYDCPTTRKKNAVKFYYALFDKKDGKLYHQPGSTPLPEGLTNDLDGGMPFWPDFVTPQGEMMKLVAGRVLKDYFSSSKFKQTSVSEEKRQKLISMASGLRPTDMIVVIVK